MSNWSVACESHEFTCNNGRCIANEFHCDYFDHCTDKSDERGCPYPPGNALCAYINVIIVEE